MDYIISMTRYNIQVADQDIYQIPIAVLDTGCDINHPNLKDRIIGGRNFTTEDMGNINNYTRWEL